MIEYDFAAAIEEEYNRLRELVGWESISKEQYANGCANSICVTARDNGNLVGFARSITDKGMMSFIVDVMVDPDEQKKGIGSHLVKMLMDAHKEWLSEGDIGYISVLSTPGKESFYKKMGFAKRPNLLLGSGMTAKIRAKRKG